MKFRKKPVVIDALQWTGLNVSEVMMFLADGHENFDHLPKNPNEANIQHGVGHTPALGEIYIPTLEGVMTAKVSDWIIKGIQGEFYPCKPDIFEKTYEAVEG